MAVGVVLLSVAITLSPQVMRALLSASVLDDDMAEHCYTPDAEGQLWQACLKSGRREVEYPPMEEYPPGGYQVMADGYSADPNLLNDNVKLLAVLESATNCTGSTVLKVADHHFDPQGATILGLLSTSHFAVHTWPERDAFTLDVYFCTPTADAQVLEFSTIVCEALK
eukprot:gene14022-21440_t